MSNIKLHFDLEKSLKDSPPELYYTQKGSDGKPLFPGISFKKRLILNRNLVTFRIEDNIRETDAGEGRVNEIIQSYKDFSFLSECNPQVLIVDPNDPKRFLGVVGFGRNEAQNVLEWGTAIYDIIEAKYPQDLHAFKINSNETEEHIVPATPNTKSTIIKAIITAITEKHIESSDAAILEYLKRICRSKPTWHDNILVKIRQDHISRWDTMRALSTHRAKNAAIELGLPYEGDKNKLTKTIGYARKFKTKKNFFYDAMVLSRKYPGQKIYLSTWVDEPIPTLLSAKRTDILNTFKGMETQWIEWIADYLDMPITDVRKTGKGRFPLVFNGFFAQDVEKQPHKGGAPKEIGLVDENGNPWERRDI